MDMRIVNDRVLVTEVEKDSPAGRLGVQTGWEIIRIGDTDIPARYREISEELANHPHRRTILVDAVQGRLLGKAGERIDVGFLDGNDSEVDLTIPLVEPRGKKSTFGHIPDFHIWIETARLDDGKIGYVRFNAFMDPSSIMPVFNQAMREWMDTEGIIIDVRGNGGGLGEMGTAMMGWFLPAGAEQMGTVVFRDNSLKMIVHPRGDTYPGNVVVLIDEMSVSAAEFFASGINDLNLGHLVGTRTAGAALGSSIERLPNGDGFQYARANYISKSTGKSLEGVGVPPHEEVFHERQALLDGRDRQLEAAINWIRKGQ
jgi:C-terminal processing protease CtpA/Prc